MMTSFLGFFDFSDKFIQVINRLLNIHEWILRVLDAIAPEVPNNVADADGLKRRQALGCGFNGLDAFHITTGVVSGAIDKLVGQVIISTGLIDQLV
jgi:hypothetical protein